MWYVKSAEQTARSLLQVFVGPEYKIIDMPSFYGALVEALCAALSRAGSCGGGEAHSALGESDMLALRHTGVVPTLD
jgi:hypothetical protein